MECPKVLVSYNRYVSTISKQIARLHFAPKCIQVVDQSSFVLEIRRFVYYSRKLSLYINKHII